MKYLFKLFPALLLFMFLFTGSTRAEGNANVSVQGIDYEAKLYVSDGMGVYIMEPFVVANSSCRVTCNNVEYVAPSNEQGICQYTFTDEQCGIGDRLKTWWGCDDLFGGGSTHMYCQKALAEIYGYPTYKQYEIVSNNVSIDAPAEYDWGTKPPKLPYNPQFQRGVIYRGFGDPIQPPQVPEFSLISASLSSLGALGLFIKMKNEIYF